MSGLDDRKKAFEAKFSLDAEQEFKVLSRRRKLMGLWAADLMKKGDEDALEYALEIVRFGLENKEQGAVVNRIIEDLKAEGVTVTEEEVRDKLNELHEQAAREVLAQA